MKIGMGTGYVRYGNILAEMTIMQLNLSILKLKISKRMNLAPLCSSPGHRHHFYYAFFSIMESFSPIIKKTMSCHLISYFRVDQQIYFEHI